MSKWKKSNANRTSKYKQHFWIAEANKLRRIAKHKKFMEKKRQKLALRNKNKWTEK